MEIVDFFNKYSGEERIHSEILKGNLLRGDSVEPLIKFMKDHDINSLSNSDSQWELNVNGDYVNQYNCYVKFRRDNISNIKSKRHVFLGQNIYINPHYNSRSCSDDSTPPPGNKNPRKLEASKLASQYERDEKVAKWVLGQSGGKCNNCDNEAPFIKMKGDFYLEVHHLKHLSQGGTDTVENTVALCPNCHREFHSGEYNEILLEEIYKKISRLIIE